METREVRCPFMKTDGVNSVCFPVSFIILLKIANIVETKQRKKLLHKCIDLIVSGVGGCIHSSRNIPSSGNIPFKDISDKATISVLTVTHTRLIFLIKARIRY